MSKSSVIKVDSPPLKTTYGPKSVSTTSTPDIYSPSRTTRFPKNRVEEKFSIDSSNSGDYSGNTGDYGTRNSRPVSLSRDVLVEDTIQDTDRVETNVVETDCHTKTVIKDVPNKKSCDIPAKADVCGFFSMIGERASKIEFWVIYLIVIALNILFLVICYFGIMSDWYKTLKHDMVNPWVIFGLWIGFTIISYISNLFVMRKGMTNDLYYGIMLMIITILSVLWALLLFNFHNPVAAFWVALIGFITLFIVITKLYSKSMSSIIFVIPFIALYGYLVYALLHMITLNGYII